MNEEGSIDEEQAGLLSSALRFSRRTVGDIMTPMDQVVCVNIDEGPEHILSVIRNQNHSRVPVYRGDKNHIIGILQIRKILKNWIMNEKIPALLPLLDRIYFTTPDVELDELLDLMSARKVTMAVVREKKNGGKSLGIVSVEDILEELVGEIYDEDDKTADRDAPSSNRDVPSWTKTANRDAPAAGRERPSCPKQEGGAV